jgi:hypothetical protein
MTIDIYLHQSVIGINPLIFIKPSVTTYGRHQHSPWPFDCWTSLISSDRETRVRKLTGLCNCCYLWNSYCFSWHCTYWHCMYIFGILIFFKEKQNTVRWIKMCNPLVLVKRSQKYIYNRGFLHPLHPQQSSPQLLSSLSLSPTLLHNHFLPNLLDIPQY